MSALSDRRFAELRDAYDAAKASGYRLEHTASATYGYRPPDSTIRLRTYDGPAPFAWIEWPW